MALRVVIHQCWRLFAVVAPWGFAVTFLWSSLPKIRHPYPFLATIYQYQAVGPSTGEAIAVVLPWLELSLSLCFAGRVLLRGAVITTILLLAAFVYAQYTVMRRGLTVACGCFGSSAHDEPVDYASLLRTFALLAAAVGYLAVLLYQQRHAPDPQVAQSSSTAADEVAVPVANAK